MASVPGKFTDEEKDIINEAIKHGLIAATPPNVLADQLTAKLGKKVSKSVVQGRIRHLKVKLKDDWMELISRTEANHQLAYLRLDGLYSKCLQEADTRTAFSVWKEMWALLSKAESSTRKKSKEPQVSDYSGPVTKDSYEDYDDDALLAKIQQGDTPGGIPAALADQLIKEDHGE